MRQVGHNLTRPDAEKFQRFLTAQGTEAVVRDDESSNCTVWVLDDDKIPSAENDFLEFVANPANPKFSAAPSATQKTKPNDRARVVDVRHEIFTKDRLRTGNVTFYLIVLAIAITLASKVPDAIQLTRYLYFSEFGGRGFPEILRGQIWRLITPIFLHDGFLHLLFNMLWLHQLGGAIERSEGSRYLLMMTIVTATVVNTSQYLVSGPLFLGMSGVVYMLFGYVWMMSRYKPGSHYVMHEQTVVFMFFWLVACLVGLIPSAANTQHVMGVLTGVIWGFLRSGQMATIKRRRKFRRDR